jgi:anti-anti-sigma regulatory factor
MNPTPASLMVASFDGGICIKVSGRANFTLSVDLKKLINEIKERGCRRFIFDLSECVNMDSTFLGVLSGIALEFGPDESGVKKGFIGLYNPHPRIKDVLETLGVVDLFEICGKAEVAAPEFQPAPHSEETSKIDIATTCLKAHQTLMAINPNNIPKFKDVVQYLAEDLKRLESGDKNPSDPPKQ